jgi:hypothetical protein
MGIHRRTAWIALVLGVFALAPALWAETNAEIETRLQEEFADRILFLRSSLPGPKLQLDSEGHANSVETAAPWTVAAEIALRRIRITDTTLEIGGERVLLAYDETAKKFRCVNSVIALWRPERVCCVSAWSVPQGRKGCHRSRSDSFAGP